MFKSNYHCHTTFCDGRAHPEAFAAEAASRRFDALGFSAHAPLPFSTEWNMERDRMDDYIAEIGKLKEQYRDQLPIYTGLEVDYLTEAYNASIPYFQNLPMDYLISSVHFITNPANGRMMCVDGPLEEFRRGIEEAFDGSVASMIKEFFRSSMKMVELGGFHIVGHIDKIQQNGHYLPQFDQNQADYSRYMNDLLAFIAEKGLIVEINTKSLNPKGMIYPNPYRFSLLKEWAIPIQVNSDSHHPSLLEDGFDRTYEMLRAVGFTHTCEMINGVWTECALSSPERE